MYLLRIPTHTRAPRLLKAGTLALVLMATSILASRAPAAAVAPLAPPSYPDASHVPNGCHLSTISFLAKFRSDFPGERGEPLVIEMLNPDGLRRSHTIALVSWKGMAWGRDEYFGVFALGRPYGAATDPATLAKAAEETYQRHAARLVRRDGMPQRPGDPADLTPAEQLREVTKAARIIPVPTTLYWAREGNHTVPLVFFRPQNGQVAVYELSHGTCVAACSVRDDAKVVSLVAARLGYQFGGALSNLSAPRNSLLADNSSR